MLLTNAGVSLTSVTSALQGEGRNGLVGRTVVRRSTRKESVQLRANAGEGAGRSSASTGLFGRVGSILNGARAKEAVGKDMVVYKGTITIMKKLAMLDLMDRGADLQDDASELMGNRVTVTLVSDAVEPSMSSLATHSFLL